MTLPSGQVTFLFTDIEGSTRLWEEHPEAMRRALARHDVLLRTAIEERGGRVFKTVGDAFCAAFSAAPAALEAAIQAQRRLRDEPWGELEAIRVRMALHLGTAEERDDDYFGPHVNRIARLLATGYGEQVILSSAVEEAVRPLLPEGVSLLDLGEHRLKDLQRPERVYQVVTARLAAAFPPLKSLDSRPNNLPSQPTPLIGRQREQEDLAALLRSDQVRLLTLLGPGGTGKTRLALQVAADLLEEFRDGTFFIPLESITNPDLVPSAVAQTLHTREEGGRPPIEAVKEYLRDRRVLLVLDNFEQVIPAAPPVAGLLTACPHLKVLVTSRSPLHLRGEREFTVPPLGLPPVPPRTETPETLREYPAVALFLERAAAVKPDFMLTQETVPAVAQICTRLDGLPLAIELAAARIKMLPPRQLLARLERRLPLLAGGARDLPRRHQTMHDTIAWSYDLLEPQEQWFFVRLATFVGGFGFDAAEAVCGEREGPADAGAMDVLEGLTSLVDKSLLRQEEHDGEARFLMLETIREYGLSRLQERPAARSVARNHAAYFLGLAREAAPELRGPRQEAWLTRLEREHGNLRAALNTFIGQGDSIEAISLAVSLYRFWAIHGHIPEGREWFTQLLAFPDVEYPSALRARALQRAAVLALWDADWRAAQPLAEESLTLFQQEGDQEGIAEAQFALAAALATGGQLETAAGLIEGSLRLWQDLGSEQGIADALSGLARLASALQDYASARDLWEDSLRRYRGLGEEASIGTALGALGRVALNLGEAGRAMDLLEQSMAIWRRLADDGHIAETLHSLGEAAEREGDATAAREAWEESLATFRRLGDRRGVSDALDSLAQLDQEEGDHQAARARWQESIALLRDLGHHADAAAAQTRLEGLIALEEHQGAPREH